MITTLSYAIYKYKKAWYYIICIASFVISVLLIPVLQKWISGKVTTQPIAIALTYLVAFILATIALPHLGFLVVKSQLTGKS